MENQLLLKKLIEKNLVPATGCTEVGAVALAVAWAVNALGVEVDEIETLHVKLDNNTYKNGYAVGIPGTNQVGLELAAAMGTVASKDSAKGLQVMENLSPEAIKKANELIDRKKIKISRIPEASGIMVRALAKSGSDEGFAEILDSHDNVTRVCKNGKLIENAPSGINASNVAQVDLAHINYEEMVEYARHVDLHDLPIVKQALLMNMDFCDEAIRRGYPEKSLRSDVDVSNVGTIDFAEYSDNAQLMTALAVGARMKGLSLPVMACAGSGNQGLVATIPVAIVGKELRASEESILRALVLSYLTTIYVKRFTGVLAPICGCGVAAGVGAGCGIILMKGGDLSNLEAQISNMIGAMTGIICDGAKPGCALKALAAVGSAVNSSCLSLKNYCIPSGNGIIGATIEDTMKNLMIIVEKGMPSIDYEVIQILDRASN